jgi:hypothetical protein
MIHQLTNGFHYMQTQVCEAGEDAPWRSPEGRLSTQELLKREWNRGKRVCPLFSVFGIFNHLFVVDWLHCADQGVTADFLGNEFEYLVKNKMPGNNQEVRCEAFREHLLTYYDDNPEVTDRLKEFAIKSFKGSTKGKGKAPRLKGSASQIRALVRFGDQMAKRFLSDDDPIESAIKTAAHHLQNCYESLRSVNEGLSHTALHNSAKIFAIQYGALWKAHDYTRFWRPMPKMHMFLELCSSGTEPQKFWCYRDEDFGGSVARQSKMKGSWRRIKAFCRHALDLFRMKQHAPRLLTMNE